VPRTGDEKLETMLASMSSKLLLRLRLLRWSFGPLLLELMID
jgi:hypothetical protein